MINLERSRMNYDNALRTQKDSAVAEQWQKQGGDQQGQQNKQLMMPPQKQPMQRKRLEQRKKLNSLSKTNAVSRINAIDAIDAIDNIDAVDGVQGIHNVNGAVDFSEAGRFDMKLDIADFVRPPAIHHDLLNKDTLHKTGQSVMLSLELLNASQTLIERAEMLFSEEEMVKSVTDAYKNALIFA